MQRTITVDVAGSPMEIFIFEPETDGPHPGIVVAQHLPVAHAGIETDPFTIDIGEKLAAAGYVAVIPFMFHWWPKSDEMGDKRQAWTDENSLKDLDAAHAELLKIESVDADRVGIMGHCWGGRVAWLGACNNTNYKVAGVFYGGRIKLSMPDGGTPPIAQCGNMKCDVLGIFGNTDENPSPADVVDLDAALNDAGIAHEFHQYDDAGHGFQDFVNPDRFRPDQTADAWEKFFTYFNARLNP